MPSRKHASACSRQALPHVVVSHPLCLLAVPSAGCLPLREACNICPLPHNATLLQAGFVQLSERQGWEGVAPGGRYFFTRNASTLVRPSMPFFA